MADDDGQRVRLPAETQLFQCLIQATLDIEDLAIELAARRIVWSQRNCALEIRKRTFPVIEVMRFQKARCCQRIGRIRIQLQSLVQRLARQRQIRVGRALHVFGHDEIGIRKRCPSAIEFRIDCHGGFVVFNRSLQEHRAALRPIVAAAQVLIVGLHAVGRNLAELLIILGVERQPEGTDDRRRNFVLHGEYVDELACVGLAPDTGIGIHLDQLYRDANPVAGLANTALEDIIDL